MAENKRPKEQIAYHYSNADPVGARLIAPPGAGRDAGKARREEQSSGAATSYSRRVVRMPDAVVQPTPWAERRAHQRRASTEPRANTRMVRRTFAQTGLPAPTGQVRAARSLPPLHVGSPVPRRSGLQPPQGTRQGLPVPQTGFPYHDTTRHPRRFMVGTLWRRLLGLFALLVIGVLGVSFALTSPTFRVQQVDVVGSQNTALVQTIEHMGIQGQNIFLVDVGALNARIGALPMVASADLQKQLPNQVTVKVAERIPVVLWRTKQGTFSVDSSGVVIAPAGETDAAGHLSTVVDKRSGAAAQQVHPGVHLNAADVAFAAQVLARLPQVIGGSDFTLSYTGATRASYGGNGSFVVTTPGGWLAYLGAADDSNPLDNRLVELQAILHLAQQQQLNLATIDLRFGLRPVYTLKKS